MTIRKSELCDLCGKGGARVRRVTRSYGRGADLLVIEKVPVISCPHCGESYLTGATLHELERIKRHRKKLSSMRSVAVANFG
jgi:YgiT-type zinc finger domain-containing protein